MSLRSSIGSSVRNRFFAQKPAYAPRETPEIETQRLHLRHVEPADLADVFEYASDPDVSRFTLWDAHKTMEETREFLKFISQQQDRGDGVVWAIVHRSLKKVIGTIAFGSYSPDHARAELGFVLSRAHWNKGITTEAVAAVLRYLFSELRLNRVEARCDLDNVASARVLEKSGMRFEGVLRQQSKIKGEYRDLKLFSILAQDYYDTHPA